MNIKINGTFILFFILSFIVGIFAILKIISPNKGTIITINNHNIFVEIADTPEKQAQGLSGKNTLNKDSGMLFIFDKPGSYSFWMKDMKFNLDFIFISSGKVVDLAENIPYPKPNENPVSIVSKKEFDKVLEINAGTIKELNIKIGDQALVAI